MNELFVRLQQDFAAQQKMVLLTLLSGVMAAVDGKDEREGEGVSAGRKRAEGGHSAAERWGGGLDR
jgi:hypothetical protein